MEKNSKKEEKNKLHERAQQDARLALDAIRAQQDAILAHQEAQKNKKKIKSVDVRWFGWFCWLCCFVAFVPVASASPSSCHLDALVPSLNGYSNTSAWDAAHGGSWFPSCFESAEVQTAVSSAEWADWGFAFTPVGFGCGEGLLMLGCLGGYSLVVSLWLGKCFLSPKKWKRRKKKGFVGFGKLRNHFDNVDKVGRLVQPYFVCFGCRWVRKKRVKRAKIRYRHKVQLKMHSRLHFWKSGKKPDSINKRLCRNRRSREILAIPRKSITQQLEEHPALPFSIPPGCYFSGGAAGSDVTKRRRQEKKLLEGLQSLLSNVQDSDAESNRSASPTARPRGRSPKKETSFESRSRDASPAWQTVSRRKRNGKGKGAGDTFVPTPILKKEESTRHVSFQDDLVEGSLISQLKSLIRDFEAGKKDNLLVQLKRLVDGFVSPKQTPKRSDGWTPTLHHHSAYRDDHVPKGTGKSDVGSSGFHDARGPKGKGKTSVGHFPQNGRDWSNPKLDANWWTNGQISSKVLFDSLEQGSKPSGSVAFVSAEEREQLQALAKVHNLQSEFALITKPLAQGEEKDVTSGEVKWCRLVGGKWKRFVVFPLCATLPKWPNEPICSKVQNAPVIAELATVRVVFCREFMTPSEWTSTVKKPIDSLMKCVPSDISIRAYGWHHNHSPKEESVIGYFKFPKKDVETLHGYSGWKAGFFQRVFETNPETPKVNIKWVQRTDQTPSAYLAAVRTIAKKEKVGIVLRRGGRSNLGLLGVKSDVDMSLLRRRWSARGVPYSWSPNDLKQVIEQESFRTVDEIVPPSHKGGIWTFKAVWDGACKVLDLGENKQMMISPWVPHPPKKPRTQPLGGPKGWITRPAAAPQEISPTIPDEEEDENMEPPDDPEQQSKGGNNDAVKRQVEGKSSTSPLKKQQRTDTLKSGKGKKDTEGTGPDNTAIWDLGGDGDCGYRCVTAVQAIRNKKTREQITQNVSSLALSLRTKTTWFLKSNNTWHGSWFADSEATVQTEDGEIPTDIPSYLDAVQRPKKWMDSFTCFAACNIVKSDIVVFKWMHGQWVFLQRFQPEENCSDEPIPLFLKDGHFTTLDPSFSMPQHWLNLETKDVGHALSFLGGGFKHASPPKAKHVIKSSSEKTTSRKTQRSSSFSDWFKPETSGSSTDRPKQKPSHGQPQSSAASSRGLSDWFQPEKKKKTKQSSGRSDGTRGSAGKSAFSEWFLPKAVSSNGPQAKRSRNDSQHGDERDTVVDDLPVIDDLIKKGGIPGVRIGRPPKKFKPSFRIWGKQTIGPTSRVGIQKKMEWMCPVCRLQFVHKNSGGLSQAKLHHLKTRHPKFRLDLAKESRQVKPVELSEFIPDSERDWTCPVCTKGLATLPHQDRKRAIRHHCITHHPEHTVRSIVNLSKKGKKQKKNGVSVQQLDNHEKYRKDKFSTHSCIMMPQEKGCSERGRLNFCKTCLSRLGKGSASINNLTCDQRLERITSNPWVKKMKRDWWERVQIRDPEWATLFLQTSGWTELQLNEFLAPKYKTNADRRFGMKRHEVTVAKRNNKYA